LARVEAFGGAIENTLAGWQAYIDANPDAWTAPVFTAWTLHRRDVIDCPDLVWQIARIAFREQRNPVLRVFADTLGPENWRDAYAYADADAADASLIDTSWHFLWNTPRSNARRPTTKALKPA
jgi:hypothetical protein